MKGVSRSEIGWKPLVYVLCSDNDLVSRAVWGEICDVTLNDHGFPTDPAKPSIGLLLVAHRRRQLPYLPTQARCTSTEGGPFLGVGGTYQVWPEYPGRLGKGQAL